MLQSDSEPAGSAAQRVAAVDGQDDTEQFSVDCRLQIGRKVRFAEDADCQSENGRVFIDKVVD